MTGAACDACGRRLRGDEGKVCSSCAGRATMFTRQLRANLAGMAAPADSSGPPGIRFEGTVAGYGRFASAELRRAAMRGLSLANPDHRAEIQAALRRAQQQDLTCQILGDHTPRPRPGGDAA